MGFNNNKIHFFNYLFFNIEKKKMQKESYFKSKFFSSFPFISLEIFSRCLKKITKLKKRIEYCSYDSENKIAKKISIMFETIAASEEYLNIMKVINQHNKNVTA